MKKFDHSGLDFWALEVLKLVHDHGSVSEVANELGQNQSSISYTLNRLRTAFKDPLFVRAGRGIEPTVRCQEIVAEVGDILDRMSGLVHTAEFDPATSEETITISCNHYERSVLLPHIIRRARAEAPGVKLKVLQSMLQGHRQLAAGECDILLSPRRAESEKLYQQKLLTDRFVCIIDKQHPLVGKNITMDRYRSCQHVALTYEGGWRPLFMDTLDQKGIDLDIAVEMPTSADLLGMIEGTNLVLTLLSILTRDISKNLMAVPGPFDQTVEIYQFWTTRTHRSPAHAWARKIIADSSHTISN